MSKFIVALSGRKSTIILRGGIIYDNTIPEYLNIYGIAKNNCQLNYQ